jgi:DNA/RNA endonuclease YhcR with UshA esterase domain
MRSFSLWCPALAGLVVAVLFAGSTAFAHHSFGATYEVNKQVKLDGKIVEFVYRNPHSFVHVEAPDPDGKVQRWAVEWGGTTQLQTAGVKRDTLKVGDKVVITGRPSRVPGEYRVLMVNLTRPSDGFQWGRNATEVVD